MLLLQPNELPFRIDRPAAMPPDDSDRLRPLLAVVELRFDHISQPADAPVDAVLFPESGMVSLIAAPDDGERIEAGVASREGFVGVPFLLGDDDQLVEARVQNRGTTLRIEGNEIRAATADSAPMRTLLLRCVLALHMQATPTAACNACHPIERPSARWLLTAHERAEADRFGITHEFVSVMLGVRRPGASLAAGIPQKAGLIHYARERVAVTDRAGLEAACDCYRTPPREFTRLLGSQADGPRG